MKGWMGSQASGGGVASACMSCRLTCSFLIVEDPGIILSVPCSVSSFCLSGHLHSSFGAPGLLGPGDHSHSYCKWRCPFLILTTTFVPPWNETTGYRDVFLKTTLPPSPFGGSPLSWGHMSQGPGISQGPEAQRLSFLSFNLICHFPPRAPLPFSL